MLPLMPRKSTVAVRHQRGTPNMARRMAVVRSPTFSAKPMAICMASTRPSGEKPWKLDSRFSKSQINPFLLIRLLDTTTSPVVGLITLTPARLHAQLTMARIRHSHKKSI